MERAARAAGLAFADEQCWPWQGDHTGFDQRANVDELVGSASAVGLYPPNPIGLHDMAGNVWEWMDNKSGYFFVSAKRVRRDEKDVENLLLFLRGGSWSTRLEGASCSSRFARLAHHSGRDMGFRVVLSLAENES